MLRAEYGDMALQGLITVGETNDAVVLADKLAGEAPDQGYFNRVIKRVELAGPLFSEVFWARRKAAGEAFEAFHLELHTASLQK